MRLDCLSLLCGMALLAMPLYGKANQMPSHNEPLQVAMLDNGKLALWELSTSGTKQLQLPSTALTTPLGSVWKLFVHSYLASTLQQEPAYSCQGKYREEIYCCEPGSSIGRDAALVKSCGLYFTPARLGIQEKDWQLFWQHHHAPHWLADLDSMRPNTRVPVLSLLQALSNLPSREDILPLLLDVVLNAKRGYPVQHLGGLLRVKTWSWHHNGDRIGGFAGWRVDGTPVWASGPGTSATILENYSPSIGTLLLNNIQVNQQPGKSECVDVMLFTRYPVERIINQQGMAITQTGALFGDFTVIFSNGNQLAISSHGEIRLVQSHPRPILVANLEREEYVARVIDREASATPDAAAMALSVVIRSYLLQNARHEGTCLHIDDSTATQRVSPRPATVAAKKIVAFTSDIVLAGAPAGYHYDSGGKNRLSWLEAQHQARLGMDYISILNAAFPGTSLTRFGQPESACKQLNLATDWLKTRVPAWRARLLQEPGYEETTEFKVCLLQQGQPRAETASRRIFARGMRSQQDQLDLTHEYLHLAFAAHPSGEDEAYIETLTRELLLGTQP